MLISRVEEEEGLVKGQEASESSGDDSHDYQTASELFDLMAKRHTFQSQGKSLQFLTNATLPSIETVACCKASH